MRYLTLTSLSLASVLMVGCSTIPNVAPKNLANNVEQHIVTGLNELEKGNQEKAHKNFLSAKALNQEASSAYSSLALVDDNKEVNLEEAGSLADTNLDKFRFYISNIRVATDDKELLSFYEKANSVDVKFMPYYHDKGSVDYFMGQYFYKTLEFKEAAKYYENVFQKYEHSKFEHHSRKMWEKSDAISRALSLSKWSVTTKKIATLDEIKRVDATVVLVNELNLDKLLKGSFKSEKKDIDRETPRDIESHPNFVELSVISKYALRGLEPIVQDKALAFAPNKPITRADFAFIIEDIVAKLKHEPSIKRKFIGSVSPFSDIKSSSAYFNAAVSAVSMGFLAPNKYQEFRPNETLSGVELIQAIAKIKEEIQL